MEDFAQVFGIFPEDKYRRAVTPISPPFCGRKPGKTARSNSSGGWTFSILIGNGDMHLKNWSLLYLDGRTPVLSPAYDFVSTVHYI